MKKIDIINPFYLSCTNKKCKCKKPMRFLLSIGGAGAQKEIFAAIIKYLMPAIKKDYVVLYINVGDYKNVWEELCREIDELESVTNTHFQDFLETESFCQDALKNDISGVHAFYHENIFEAVYTTNMLMRSTDVLVTKPSELAFYPIPKLFIKRI